MNMIGILIGITITAVYLTVLVERTRYLHETLHAWEQGVKHSYHRDGLLSYKLASQALRTKQVPRQETQRQTDVELKRTALRAEL